jgi:hypothetical protein
MLGLNRNKQKLAMAARAREALEFAHLQHGEQVVDGIVLKPGEMAYLVVEGAGYIEPNRLPGQWSGGSRGVSLRVAKGVSYRIGRSSGTYRQGAEALQATDRGRFVITGQRCFFIGTKRTTEWLYSKLLGFSLEGEGGYALFNVSNRQKPSGVVYGTEREATIEATIAAAIARFQGPEVHRGLLAELRSAAEAADAEAGIVTAPAVQPPPMDQHSAPAGWMPDPSGKFELRYWSGDRWTEHVACGGVMSVDPRPTGS